MEQHGRQRYEDYKSFMRRHQQTVWRVCYDFAHGDIPRCEDMVQEVWIMLWLKFDTMTGRTEWQQRVWVRRVTRSVLVDLYRREAGNADVLVRLDDLCEDIADEDVRVPSDVAERIDDLFAALTPDEQRLMRMRLDGYSAEEIAAGLKIETNAVYQRVNRIMNKLRNYATRL
jgi:RNA polymerase sigma factor (sigma-70 family)